MEPSEFTSDGGGGETLPRLAKSRFQTFYEIIKNDPRAGTSQDGGAPCFRRRGKDPPVSRRKGLMDTILNPDTLLAFVTLTALEIVLGIDNIIFIAILAGRLPHEKRAKARTVGLALAMFTRIGLLFSLTLIMRLTSPLFSVLGMGISGRDIILLAGGLFLIAKSTVEIHKNVEGEPSHVAGVSPTLKASFVGVIVQIMILDIVFSLDSVITAVGLSNRLFVMAGAIISAVIVMMFLAGPLAHFVESHPTVKILALAFLLLIGTALMAEGLEFHISKGYLYFAMAFSTFVEMLNIRMRKKAMAKG